MAVTFQQAFEVAMRRCSPEEWRMLSSGEQTTAIYREMRRMDIEADQLIQERAAAIRGPANG